MEAETDVPTQGSETKASEQLRSHTQAMREDIRELGRLTKGAAQEKIDEARQAAGDLYDQGRRKAGDLEDQIAEYVREKPMKSLLIAAGVGAVLGMIWTRR